MHRETPRKVSAIAVLACAWPALLLATACLLPFLNKPFLVDDPWFLTMAQQIVKHPAHPMDFRICWVDRLSDECRNADQFASGNALLGQVAQGYVLVPTVMGGAHEWMAHLTQLIFVWIAVLAMASLVLRFGWNRAHAIAGALLLVAVAPFLPMASTAMPDILATALALVAMERLAAWKAERKGSQGTVAAVALGLAGFARPHLVLLLPLAAFFLLESTKPREILEQIRRKFWLWTPVLSGCVLLAAIIAILREPNRALNPLPVLSGLGSVRFNVCSYLLYLVFPIPLGLCWFAGRLKRRQWRAVIIVAMAAAGAFFVHPWLVSFFAFVGFGMMIDLLFEALDKADHTGLFLMLWVLIPAPIVIYFQFPPKYLLPCMPAVILLCFRLMDGYSARFSRVAAVALIVAGTGYSLLILRSDAESAWFGRDAMYQLIQPHIAAGEKVWYDGNFSAYWYAPLAGATQTFPGGPQPKPGDLLVVGLPESGSALVLPRFPHRTLVASVTHKYSFGRTTGAGAGLYSNHLGYWMWGFGESKNDRYELWRID